MRIHYLTLSIFCILFWNLGAAQDLTASKELADLQFAHGKYHEALGSYKSIEKEKPNNLSIKYRLGVCYLEIGQIASAEQFLSFVAAQKGGNEEVWYHLGRVKHLKSQFMDAIQHFKKYVKAVDGGKKRAYAKHFIRQCAAAREIKYQEELAIVDNLGNKVNGRLDDYGPVSSPATENKIYFSSERQGSTGGLRDLEGLENEILGQYKADIFSSQLINGEWTATLPLNSQINSSKNDEVLGFSDDATVMYYYKGNLPTQDGVIFTDTLRGTEAIIYPTAFRSPMKIRNGDETPQFFSDSTIIYASKQEGGFGGLDLYLIQRLPGGFWTRPVNLGPEVNSPFDEKAPFLAKDGRTLYYSSNRVESLGGFDIFKCVFRDDILDWSKVENMGAPINSPADDLHFSISKDGLKSFFVSDRIGGAGGKDIYVGYFKTERREQLITSRPKSFNLIDKSNRSLADNGYPTNPNTNMNSGTTNNNNANGSRETVVLAPLFYTGDNIVTVGNIKELNKVVELVAKYPLIKVELSGHTNEKDPEKFRLYFSYKKTEKAANYLINNGVKAENIIIKGLGSNYPVAKNKNADGTVSNAGQKLNNRIEIRLTNIETLPLDVTTKWPKINERQRAYKRSTYDNSQKGLVYKVQVAALRSMYDSDIVVDYSDSMLENDDTRNLLKYTVGIHRNFSSAKRLERELRAKGVNNAFVVPYVDGLRLEPGMAEALSETHTDLRNYLNN